MASYFFFIFLFFHEKKENKGVSMRSCKAKREESVEEIRNSSNSQLLWGRSGFGSLSLHGVFGCLGVRTDRKVQWEFWMGCGSAGFGEQRGDFGIFLKRESNHTRAPRLQQTLAYPPPFFFFFT